jgi:hypothetical protein
LSCPADTAMILPIADDLVLRIKAWDVTVDSFLASAVCLSQRMSTPFSTYLESRRDEDPAAHGSGCENSMDQVRKASGNAGSLHSPQG